MEFDFEKSGTVADLSTVPEKYRGLYAEGKDDAGETVFGLVDHAKGIVADYIGTNKALSGARNDKTNASNESAQRRQALKAFDDIVEALGVEVGDDGAAIALRAFVEDLQGKVKNGKELSINVDKIKADFEKRLQEGIATKDKELEGMHGALSKHLVSDAASRALAEAKGSIDLLLPHVIGQCKVVKDEDGSYSVRVLDGQGDARTDSAGGWMGVGGLVEEMKGKDAFSRAFESEVPAGGGTPPRNALNMRQNPNAGRELSATEKIAIGLKKGQARNGRGA